MIIELQLLFPVVAEIEPPWIRPINKHNLLSATPALQLLLTRDCIVHIAKAPKPNEPVQAIALGEALYFSIPMLIQTSTDIIRDPNVQRRAMFVGESVHPIVVVTHAIE